MYPATSFKYNVDNCLTRIDTDDLRKNIKSSKLYSSLCLTHKSCYSAINREKINLCFRFNLFKDLPCSPPDHKSS